MGFGDREIVNLKNELCVRTEERDRARYQARELIKEQAKYQAKEQEDPTSLYNLCKIGFTLATVSTLTTIGLLYVVDKVMK